jgi:hypothetical protein
MYDGINGTNFHSCHMIVAIVPSILYYGTMLIKIMCIFIKLIISRDPVSINWVMYWILSFALPLPSLSNTTTNNTNCNDFLSY